MHVGVAKTVEVVDSAPLDVDYGGRCDELSITWEQWGDPTLPDSRTVVVMPSFSNSSHAASNLQDPAPGWWEGMVGPGLAIDTNHFRVICGSNLGAPFGTTSPLTENPATGKPWGKDFPQITPADQARCQRRLHDHLGLGKVHAVVGSSLGGMVALQYASLYPDSVGRVVAIATTGKTTPGTVALRRVQRQAIVSDPDFAGGDYHERGIWPSSGMKVAREMGMVCYRSREEFDQRFDWNIETASIDDSLPLSHQPVFAVERYMQFKAQQFAYSYDPNCYLLQSRAMDLMDLGRNGSFAQGVLDIHAQALVIGVKQDQLIPCSEARHLADLLMARPEAEGEGSENETWVNGGAMFEELDSWYGHDAFFIQHGWFGPRIRSFLERGMSEELAAERRTTTGEHGP